MLVHQQCHTRANHQRIMDSTDPLNGYDSDSVSLTSTVASSVGSNKEYVVDRILAELEGDGNFPSEYLIRWDRKKYSLLESSWGTGKSLLFRPSRPEQSRRPLVILKKGKKRNTSAMLLVCFLAKI